MPPGSRRSIPAAPNGPKPHAVAPVNWRERRRHERRLRPKPAPPPRERAARKRVEGLRRARLTTFHALARALADLRKIEAPGGPGKDSIAARVTWRLVAALTAQIDRLQAKLAD